MKFYAYCQTHWDREWYQPFEEFRLRLIDVFEEIIIELDSNNMQSFYMDGQTIATEDYLAIKPEKRAKIEELISKNKLYVGPWYVLSDEFLVSGESLLRNLLIGTKQAKKLGSKKFTGYLPDTFGHVAYMPMLLNSANINSTVVWRGTGNLKSEFLWKSKDDSSVLAINLTEGYFIDVLNSKTTKDKKSQLLKKLLKKIKKMSVFDMALFPLGGDHLGAVKELKQQLGAINPLINPDNIIQSTIFDYIDSISEQQEKETKKLKTITSELRSNNRSNLLPGVYSTRLYLKKENTKTEWRLRKLTEPLNAFLAFKFSSASRNNELDYAWKTLIKNHPHDSICGCSIDSVHREMMTRFEKVNQISDGIINRNLFLLAENTGKNEIIIYNASNQIFNGVIEIETTEKLENQTNIQFIESVNKFPLEILLDTSRPPYREDIKEYYKSLTYVDNIPAGGVKTIKLSKLKELTKPKIEIEENFIDNGYLRVEINKNGSLNLTDKQIGKTYQNIHIITDKADIGDTYSYCPIKGDKTLTAKFIETKIIENGNLRGTLRLKYILDIPATSDFETEIRSENLINQYFTVDLSLSCNSKFAEFNINFENKSKNHLVQLKFDTGEKISSTLSEDGYGTIKRRFNSDYNIEDFMPAKKPHELKTNTAPMQRFVCANGLGIITEGLTEYEITGSEIAITLLRSVGILSQGPMGTRSVAAGPPLETPEAQCLGENSYRYALCVADKPIELFNQCDIFMGSILSIQGQAKKQSKKTVQKFLSVDNSNIYIYAIKTASTEEEKGIIVRVYNKSSKVQSFNFKSDLNFENIFETNSLEEIISNKNFFKNKIEIQPFKLKTFLLT
jgi:alpha-mannosidase